MNEWLLEERGLIASYYCAQLINEPLFYINEPINVSLLQKIKQWINQGHKILFVTAPNIVYNNELSIQSKIAQIQRYFGTKYLKNIIFTNKKYQVEGDYLIDDSPEMVEQQKQAKWKLIVVDSLYSKHIQTEEKVDVTSEEQLTKFESNYISTSQENIQ